MDRYVIREPRRGEYPEGNQMIAFSATTSSTGNNITIPENAYYGGYEGEIRSATVQTIRAANNAATPAPRAQGFTPNVIQAQGQMVSGIDQRYLAAYAGTSAAYAQTAQDAPLPMHAFGNDYHNRNFIGAETNSSQFYNSSASNQNFNLAPHQANNQNFNRAEAGNPNLNRAQAGNQNFNRAPAYNQNFNTVEINNHNMNRELVNARNTFVGGQANQNSNIIETNNFHVALANNNFNRAQVNNNQSFIGAKTQENNRNFNSVEFKRVERNDSKQFVPQSTPNVSSTKTREIDLLKHETTNQVKTPAEKLKELQKSGTRVFSGPVEKIIKWHKSLQDIGVMILYEIVGKCENVRAGDSCAKYLVVRDENGPAIQVVYYEIDFLLPELKPPCTVRVIGRMMPGTSRFHAFNVRPATGDDVATLPRRAAVAAHHVAKLCKEYGVEVIMFK